MNVESNKDDGGGESPAAPSRRFFVKAGSVNAVRRALYRSSGRGPRGGTLRSGDNRVLAHNGWQSMIKNWPIIESRLEKAGLEVSPAPAAMPRQS